MTYNNELYQCIQGHTSEPNWMPPATPALWQDLGPCSGTTVAPTVSTCSGVAAWNGNFIYYGTGSRVVYNSELYQCLQAHTSEPNWMPPATPALWQDLGSCSGAVVPALSSNTVLRSVIAGPNISRGNQPIRFYIGLETPAQIRVDIFTLQGQQVIRKDFYGNAGPNAWQWDLQNAAQSSVASGLYVYTVHVTANGNVETKTGKVVILH